MPATTYPEFDGATEGLEVARAFPDAIRGKTVLVTGVNLKGIGFSTAQAFVSLALCLRNPVAM
ncbi:hypothetical protein IMZ48_48675 [Candidatus Bathyarchaeota archaeon]|nr:hypothetical protein [Candidatus Bathyarchaeota archaeon]